MLHLSLAANVLNAVGGIPDLTRSDFVPSYPTYLPDGEEEFVVNLAAFSKDSVASFLKIERPRKPQRGDRLVSRQSRTQGFLVALEGLPPDTHFYSIGEFYDAILDGLRQLYEEHGAAIFCGDPRRQIGPEHYYSGGGTLYPVTGIETAVRALQFIIEQGEGYTESVFDADGELAHYYRFEQLILGQYYQMGDKAGAPSGPHFDAEWDETFRLLPNARLSDYPAGSELQAAAAAFCSEYGTLLGRLSRAFCGEPGLLDQATTSMFALKQLANALVRNPIPGRDANGAPVFRDGR
jgi:hypothetical protein